MTGIVTSLDEVSLEAQRECQRETLGDAVDDHHRPSTIGGHRLCAVRVAPEVQVLDGKRHRRVLADEIAHARVDMCEPPLERQPGARVDHAAVERGQPPAVRQHDSIPGVCRARVYAEDDH